MSKRRIQYDFEFKLKVVARAQEIGCRPAGREFEVDEKNVRRWLKSKDILARMPKKRKTLRHRPPKWPVLEENLAEWIRAQRNDGRSVSTVAIRLKAKLMAQQMSLTDFTGGACWTFHFMRRQGLSVRARTTIGQKLPADWEEKERNFRKFVADKISELKITESAIFNMDEVPLTFDAPPSRTVTNTGDKTVYIRTTGNEKTSFTVVLGCSAAGEKLRPLLIFKRKTIPKLEFPSGVVVKCNEKGWMTESVMMEWLEEVYRRRNKMAFFQPKGLLIMDSMRAHLQNSVKQACKTQSTALAIIPGGLTKKLQPLDITVNRVFKVEVRKRWEGWMTDGLHTFTKSGHMRKASFEEVSKWVLEAWAAVKPSTIQKAFTTAGIISKPSNVNPDALVAYSDEETDDEDNAPLQGNFLELFGSNNALVVTEQLYLPLDQ